MAVIAAGVMVTGAVLAPVDVCSPGTLLLEGQAVRRNARLAEREDSRWRRKAQGIDHDEHVRRALTPRPAPLSKRPFAHTIILNKPTPMVNSHRN